MLDRNIDIIKLVELKLCRYKELKINFRENKVLTSKFHLPSRNSCHCEDNEIGRGKYWGFQIYSFALITSRAKKVSFWTYWTCLIKVFH